MRFTVSSTVKCKSCDKTKCSFNLMSFISLNYFFVLCFTGYFVTTINGEDIVMKDKMNQDNFIEICQQDSNEHENGFLYTYEVDECKLSCYILTTSKNLSDLKTIYYDETVVAKHNFRKKCRDSVHYCAKGHCQPMIGQLQVIIYTVEHNHVDIEGSTVDPGDIYIEIEVNNQTGRTHTLNNTYQGEFNTRPFEFDQVHADDVIYLTVKDQDEFLDDIVEVIRLTPAQVIQQGYNARVTKYTQRSESDNLTVSVETLITFTPTSSW